MCLFCQDSFFSERNALICPNLVAKSNDFALNLKLIFRRIKIHFLIDSKMIFKKKYEGIYISAMIAYKNN